MPYNQADAITAINNFVATQNAQGIINVLGDLDTGVIIPESTLLDALDGMSRTLTGKTSAIY